MLQSFRLVACVLILLSFSLAPVDAAIDVTGTVTDVSGGAIAGADVALMTPERTTIGTARTDRAGKFRIAAPAPGTYLLEVRATHLGEVLQAIVVGPEAPAPVTVVLELGRLREEVTVTASREQVLELRMAGQPVNVIDEAEIANRVKTVVAQAVEGEAGVHLQRTSPTMAGIFVRGLTGNKVNVFVDGVRYSNGAQRGGVNTFLDLIEPDSLEAVEVLRGPSSAQYGTDALGGSVQFLSRPPTLRSANGPRWTGTFGASGGTAHANGGGSALAGYMAPAFGVTASVAGRKTGLARTGEGIDSHAAVTRFFGVKSTLLMDTRLPDTGFWQMGGAVRTNWVPNANTHLVASYLRSTQDDGKRYDQLLGGDGNLIADLNDLSLDLFSARVERLGAGWFDEASIIYSLNSQREERVNQGGNGNPTATISHEPERTTVHGLQAVFTKQFNPRAGMTVGGDGYFEGLTSVATNVNPTTGAVSARRPRIPDGATYTHGGVYAQANVDVQPRLRLNGSVRFGGAHYSAKASDGPVVNGQPLWPDDALTASAVTFRAGATFTPADPWTVLVSVSRGFRAPHMTDLGTLGLTGSGFEVAAPDVAGMGGTVGTTADATAVSNGDPVAQVGPETSLQYEGSVRFRNRVFRTELVVFVNTIYDNIQKQTLILPQGAVGLTLGGTPIIAQNANGAVFVSATTTPVLVRANVDNARIWGIEHSAEARLGHNLSLHTAFTYNRARDLATDLPPNIEGGTPAPDAWISLRWSAADGQWWVEPYTHIAWEQTHLSSLDLGDRRTGAGRSRSSIRSFFINGARARGWISPGADGAFGTADDLLTATGETLAQIQDRVLGVGVNSSSLFTAIPGYTSIGVRAGLRMGRHQLSIDAENLTDTNYRGISWGMDAPGAGVSVRYAVRF
jgi:outer membrane receptor protein involved in Fe transport